MSLDSFVWLFVLTSPVVMATIMMRLDVAINKAQKTTGSLVTFMRIKNKFNTNRGRRERKREREREMGIDLHVARF